MNFSKTALSSCARRDDDVLVAALAHAFPHFCVCLAAKILHPITLDGSSELEGQAPAGSIRPQRAHSDQAAHCARAHSYGLRWNGIFFDEAMNGFGPKPNRAAHADILYFAFPDLHADG